MSLFLYFSLLFLIFIQIYTDLPDDLLRREPRWFHLIRRLLFEFYTCHADAVPRGLANNFPFGVIVRVQSLEARLLSLINELCHTMHLPASPLSNFLGYCFLIFLPVDR